MKPDRWWMTARPGLSCDLLLSLLLLCSAPAIAVEVASSYENPETAGAVPGLGNSNEGTWIVEPGEPGPDIPPAGRSLFDYLVSDNSGAEPEYRVPFPFAALRSSLERRLRKNSNGTTPIQQVLIPLGRSLQRSAAAPDFFRYPRVVLAVDGEPQAGPSELGMFLKDRLYLGYLENPGVLEVISYNEGAGRFEFQIVSDYREGGSPKVTYANRAVCTACHQNATPIFSRPLWGETNANPEIAALLRAKQRDYYGIPYQLGIDVPGAVDDATDRANLIPAVHLLWQQGCGEDPQNQSARSCRAKVLGFALQYRLTNSLGFSNAGNPDWAGFMQTFTANWNARWPQGLLLSSPDVPNRIPVSEVRPVLPAAASRPVRASVTEEERVHQQRHIPSELEPLQPRAPLERWQAAQAATELVTGVAGFFAQIDIERLDARLFTLGQERGSERSRYQSGCRLTSKPTKKTVARLVFQCDEPASGLRAEGRLYFRDDELLRGTLDRLVVGEGQPVGELALTGEAVERTAQGWRVRLGLSRGAIHGRLPDGNALRWLELSWKESASLGRLPGRTGTGNLTLETVEDFSILKRAIAVVSASGDALSAGPLRRAAIMRALAGELGMPDIAVCCLQVNDLPPLQVDEPDLADTAPGTPRVNAAPESVFYRRCSLCHRTNERFPPNFLMGEPAEVREKLAQCAERLFLRLSMWKLPEAQRTKTPMPPIQAFHQIGLDPASWEGHPELVALQGYAQQALLSQTGITPQLEALVARGYENLRPCLAQAD